jgi:hypothetical protein
MQRCRILRSFDEMPNFAGLGKADLAIGMGLERRTLSATRA